MGCPLCGSSQVRKDYAPARGYVLAAVGLAMLFLRAFFNPEILSPVLAAESQRVLLVGVLVFGYGAYHLLRHGNRYCGECGFRFRATLANQASAVSLASARYAAAAQAAENGAPGSVSEVMFGKDGRDDEKGERKKVAIRFEPVLACLKFKDAAARAEAARTLAEATGQNFGEDYDAWKAWLIENRKIRG